MKPTPYNNNAKKHPLAQSEEPKPHPVEVVEIKPVEEPKTDPEDEDISLVERWDDVEIRINQMTETILFIALVALMVVMLRKKSIDETQDLHRAR